MTLLDHFQLPEYQVPEIGCEVQVRWPGMVAAARSSSPAVRHRPFYEFAPIRGGYFLGGVGYERAASDEVPFLREQILGHVLAGHDLDESLHSVLEEQDRGEVCYVLFDPIEATLQVSGCGPSVSAVHVAAGTARLFQIGREQGHESPKPFILGPEEALLLVAHPRAWAKHLLTIVDQSLPENPYDFGESDALALCGRIETLMTAGGTSSLVIFRSGSTATHPSNGPAGQEDPPATLEYLNTSLTLPDLEFLDELAASLAH